MTLDQLIEHLQSLRTKHGGGIKVMLGQSTLTTTSYGPAWT